MIEPARAMQPSPQVLFAGLQCMLNYCLQECCQTFHEHDHALRYASFLTLRPHRRAPPPVGSVVTYRYRERTPNGLPRFASFMRVRAPE